MACLHPLIAIKTGQKHRPVLIRKGSKEFPLNKDRRIIDTNTGEVYEEFYIPCGRCLQCRLAYARAWSHRCLCEATLHNDNWFLTLTYDNENLPMGKKDFASLQAKDMQDFLKLLRWDLQDKGILPVIFDDEGNNINAMRFYGAGEYGDTTFRPHLHLIAFNLPLSDLKHYAFTDLGDEYFTSDYLNDKWGKGHVVIGEVTEASASYVARYCQKKVSKVIDYDYLGIEKEFVRMSRRPGIGYDFVKNNLEEIYKNDKIYLPRGKIAIPPRYFDMYAEKFELPIEKIKSERKCRAMLRDDYLKHECSQEFYKRMNDLEQELVKKASSLKRNL